MTPRPDSQSLTRLLVSAGAFLVVAAFVVPGLILRDTSVLTISRSDLDRLTPTAQMELERRQGIARDAGKAAPFLAVILLASGSVLIALGVPRLKRQEQSDDERRLMEVDKLRRELRPQSAEERKGRLREDLREEEQEKAPPERVEEQPQKEPRPVAKASSPPAPARGSLGQALLEAASAESAVLGRLTEIAPPLYDLQTQVAVRGKPKLLLDALLISEVDQLPDIVVEIKYSRGGNASLKNRISDAEQQLLRYLTRFDRTSIGWLILMVAEGPSPGRRRELEESVTQLDSNIRLSIISQDNLDELALPL